MHGWCCTDADLLGVIDADLQHPPEVIVELLEEVMRGADIAIASRYVHPHSMDGWSPMRKFVSWVGISASIAVQRREIRVKDPLSGFFIVRRKCIEGLHFQQTGFKLLLEILAKAPLRMVREVPFRFSPRALGHSKADLMTCAHYASLLWRLWKNAHPSRPTLQMVRPDVGLPSRSLQLVLGLLPLVLGSQLIIAIAYLPTALRGEADFRSMYTAGILLTSGGAHQLYNYSRQKRIQDETFPNNPALLPYNHLPYEALLFAPLARLSYQSAFWCWLGMNLIVAVLCCLCLQKRLWRLEQLWSWLPVLFLFGFAPIAATLMQGQDSILTLLLFSLALVILDAGMQWFAGLLIGLAFYKFQLVLPVVFLFCFWRKWRLVAGIMASIAATLTLSILLSGAGQLAHYVYSLQHLSSAFPSGTSVLQIMPAARMPDIRGMVAAIPFLPPTTALAMTIMLSLLVSIVSIWAGRKAPVQWQFAIAVCATTLVGYHVLAHDLSILLIPLAVLLDKSSASTLWIVPITWLSPLLCFFGYNQIVPIVVVGLFIVVVQISRQQAAIQQSQLQPVSSGASAGMGG